MLFIFFILLGFPYWGINSFGLGQKDPKNVKIEKNTYPDGT